MQCVAMDRVRRIRSWTCGCRAVFQFQCWSRMTHVPDSCRARHDTATASAAPLNQIQVCERSVLVHCRPALPSWDGRFGCREVRLHHGIITVRCCYQAESRQHGERKFFYMFIHLKTQTPIILLFIIYTSSLVLEFFKLRCMNFCVTV